VEAVFSALALSQIAWHDWSTILARVKLTKMIEMDTVQNASSCNRHRVEVWMLILALLTLRLIFWRFVEWIASLLRLSDAAFGVGQIIHIFSGTCSGLSELQNRRFWHLLRVL